MPRWNHKCYRQVNKELAKYNTKLVTNMFDPNMLLVETTTIEKKRGSKPKLVACSHCPFCGEKLSKEK